MGDRTDDFDAHFQSSKRSRTYPYAPINPVARTNAPRLKDIASSTVAITFWKRINIFQAIFKANYFCAKEAASCWKSMTAKVEKFSSKLPVPNTVQQQINEKIASVNNEIINWATYHFRSVFLNAAKDYVAYNHVCDLIWHSDGTIDCKETARKISKAGPNRVSNLDKFRFLSIYCLEDELRQMSSAFLSTFQQDVDFEQHPLIAYWNRYFCKRLDLIPNSKDVSLDCFMFRHGYVDNWPAKEYFFDRMSPEEQVQNAIWMIDNHGITYQKLLLMKLNESQRISVYIARAVQIMKNYVKAGASSSDVLGLWSEVRHLITQEEFRSLISKLLKAKAAGEVLTGIWTNVDADFKHHVLTHNENKFLKRLLYSYDWTEDINFSIIVLQDLNPTMKTSSTQEILEDFCDKLLTRRENLPWVDRVSEVYFGENSPAHFKHYFVLNSKSIKKLCLEYCSTGDVKTLNDMLTSLFPQTPDRIVEYKRNLLQSPDGILKCVELVGFNAPALDAVIADIFPTPDSAAEFRKNIMFSTPCLKKLRSWIGVNDKHLEALKTVVDTMFASSEEDKKKFKRLLIDELASMIRDFFDKSNESHLKSLLIWVFDYDENLVKEYKKSIQVNEIFDPMLREAVYPRPIYGWFHVDDLKKLENRDPYGSLNRFLIWFFETPSEVKKYKLSRIYDYKNMDLITSLCRKRKEVEVRRLQTVMRWFFEKDKAEIAKFKKMYNGKGNITSVL